MKALLKTISWAAVSFVLILGIELITHALLHGTEGFDVFAKTAVTGVLVACILKTPVYWAHETAWDRKPKQKKIVVVDVQQGFLWPPHAVHNQPMV